MMPEEFVRRAQQTQAAVNEVLLMLDVVEFIKQGGMRGNVLSAEGQPYIAVPVNEELTLRVARSGSWWLGRVTETDSTPIHTPDMPEASVRSDSKEIEEIAVYVIRCLFRAAKVHNEKLTIPVIKK